jgi:L,D-peptidoglycan transpeptidase YkuD (ErfK/YbiS/YcfS/YnhG family)
LSTGNATQVITVVAPAAGSTTATLQAWRKTSTGWARHDPAVTAHVGRQGLSTHKREGYAVTPIGSFTLTQAFGRDPNPGTSVPYTQTTPADWWVSEPSPLYNTRQRCTRCSFAQGTPNEHLYYSVPYYDYALVVDYNTRNAPGGVRQGAGSAIFLHVTVGRATAGCVSIPQDNLTSIMKWLTPSAHPRILIGIA